MTSATASIAPARPSDATAIDSPLLRMVQQTPTDYWNDSCAVDELAYAVQRGATGATSNPSIVFEVLNKEKSHWIPRIREIAEVNPTWNEIDHTWYYSPGLLPAGWRSWVCGAPA
jgi:hypothetical protein